MLANARPRTRMPRWPYVCDESHPLSSSLASLHVFDPTQRHRLIDLSPMRTAGDITPVYGPGPCPVPRALPLGGGWSTRGTTTSYSKTRNPTGDGTFTGTWTGTASSRYTLVDDHPDSAGTDSLTHGTTAGRGTFTYTAFDLPPGATITNVQVLYYDQKTGSQTSSWGAFLRVNGVDQATNDAHNPANAVWTLRTATYTTNPATSAAWTVADVNGTGSNPLQGFGVVATDASPTCKLSSIQLVVNYDAGSPWPNSFLGSKAIMATPVKHTVACLHAWSDQAVAGDGYLCLANTYYGSGWWLGKLYGQANYQYIVGDGASDTRLDGPSSMTFDWTPRMVVATNDGAGNAALHVQGKGKWTSGTFKTTIGQANPLRIGYERDGNGAFQGDMYLVAVWHRVLSDGEIRLLMQEPFCMLRPVMPGHLGRLQAAAQQVSLAATAVGDAVLANVKTFKRTLEATAVGAAALSRLLLLQRSLSAVAVGVASQTKSMYLTLAATSVGVAVLNQARFLSQALNAVAVGVAALTSRAQYARSLVATAVGTATVSTLKTFFRSLDAVSTGVVNVQKMISKTLGAVSTGVSSLSKGLYNTLSATASGIADLTKAPIVTRNLDAVSVGIAALANRLLYYRTLSATAVGVVALGLVKTFYKSLDAVSVGISSLSKKMFISMSAIGAGAASQVKKMFKALDTTSVVQVSLQVAQVISKTLTAVAIGIVELVTQFIAGGGAPNIDAFIAFFRRRRR